MNLTVILLVPRLVIQKLLSTTKFGLGRPLVLWTGSVSLYTEPSFSSKTQSTTMLLSDFREFEHLP